MMFTFASRVGNEIRVSPSVDQARDNWQKGVHLPRKEINGIDRFWTTVVGWIHDGKQVHDAIVHQPALATLSRQGSLEAWQDGYGATIQRNFERNNGIDAHFKGKRGHAEFTVWSDSDNINEQPVFSDIQTKFGGTNLVAWRQLHFEGEFSSPSGTEKLEGLGYFQRVCMNIPMFPWKWFYTVFEDGSIYSSFGPYLGFQMFRRGDKFLPRTFERVTSHLGTTSYFYDAQTGEIENFERYRLQAFPRKGTFPWFTVEAWNRKGNFIKFIANAHGHAQFLLDRRVVKRLWISRFNYNEFMFKVEKLQGKIGQKTLNKQTLGQGWGNHEYTWGFSL